MSQGLPRRLFDTICLRTPKTMKDNNPSFALVRINMLLFRGVLKQLLVFMNPSLPPDSSTITARCEVNTWPERRFTGGLGFRA